MEEMRNQRIGVMEESAEGPGRTPRRLVLVGAAQSWRSMLTGKLASTPMSVAPEVMTVWILVQMVAQSEA